MDDQTTPGFRWTTLALLASAASGCATTFKPCTWGGDTSWNPPIKGTNKTCYQKDAGSGPPLNEGPYREWSPKTGKVILQGQFKEGKKDGKWIQYDESGKVIQTRYFESGEEQDAPGSLRSSPSVSNPR